MEAVMTGDKKTGLYGVIALFAIVLLAACDAESPAETTAPTPDPTESPAETTAPTPDPTESPAETVELPPPEMDTVTIGVTTLEANTFIPVFAQAADLYGKYGLEVRIVPLEGGTRGLAAIIAGQVDATVTGPNPTITSLTTESPLQDVAVFNNRYLDCIFVASDITDADTFRGKRLATNQLGGQSHSIALITLDEFGLTTDDVELIAIGGQGDRVAALRAGSVDAAIADCTLVPELEPDGFHIMLRLSEVETTFPGTVLNFTTEFIQENPNTVLAVVAVQLEAMNMLRTGSGMELMVEELAEFAQVDAADAREEIEAFLEVAQWNLRSSVEAYDNVKVVAAVANPAAADVDASEAITAEFLDRLEELGFHSQLGIDP